jgi:hypothetical protein
VLVTSAAGWTSLCVTAKEPTMKIKTKVRAGRDCGGGPIPTPDIIIA